MKKHFHSFSVLSSLITNNRFFISNGYCYLFKYYFNFPSASSIFIVNVTIKKKRYKKILQVVKITT